MPRIRLLVALALAWVAALGLVPAHASRPPATPGAGSCPEAGRLAVPGAELQVGACLDDLTTAGTAGSGHTDPADWAGLHPAGARNPRGVPGIQLDGYFPDTPGPGAVPNPTHGWNHDAQFVIRLPREWSGGLVVTGSPGVREQYAHDFTIADWALARGYAYAATDKGNTGAAFFRDGRRPGDAIAEWNARVTQLAAAARAVVAQRYGRPPRPVLAAGISNGGYLVRWQLERHPELFDGGLDWEGALWRRDGPNLLMFLPPALRAYPTGDADGVRAAGFPAGSEPLWDYHYNIYWDLTQRIYREELDPGYDGASEAGTPFCAPGGPEPGCDADYEYATRPRAVRQAVARISLTGRIRRPLITLHGTLDALLPIGRDSDVYASMVRTSGRGRLFRYYRVTAGTHVDGLYDTHPDLLRPILPCFRAAFAALEGWTGGHTPPPPSATLPRPESGDLANSCSLSVRRGSG
jgi:hypothetical protein